MAKARIWDAVQGKWITLDSSNAEKLGGQLPEYYASKQSVDDLTQTVVDNKAAQDAINTATDGTITALQATVAANKTTAASDLASAVSTLNAKDASQDTVIGGVSDRVTVLETSRGAANGIATLDSSGLIPVSQLPNIAKEGRVVADLTERDAITDLFMGAHAIVIDATPDVTSGGAEYVWDGDSWNKVAQINDLDLIVKWANIEGKPTATGNDIDQAIADLHTLQSQVGGSGGTSIQSQITDEIARAQGAEATLQSNIDSEVTRAKAAEQVNSDAIAAETSRAQSAEAVLQTNLTSEVTRATNAETALGGRVTTLENRVNVIMSSAAPADITALWVDLTV